MNTKLFYSAILLCFLFSCHNDHETSDIKLDSVDPPQESQQANKQKHQIPIGKQDQVALDTVAVASPPQKSAATTDWDKKIIKTAFIKLEVKDFKAYNGSIHNSVKQFGGYIALEEQNVSDQQIATTISIKVPVDQFDAIMNQLPGNDSKIIEKKITTEDVTGEIVDVKSRMQAKMQMRLKYLEFLKQSKNMQEVLQVENEINSIQEEIESASGRMEYLSHASAMSTINLTFYQPIDGYNPNEKPSFFTRFINAIKYGATELADFMIGLVSIWPVILIAAGAWLVFRRKLIPKKQTA